MNMFNINIKKHVDSIKDYIFVISLLYVLFIIYNKVMSIDEKIDSKFKTQELILAEKFNSFECQLNLISKNQNDRIQNIENTLIKNTYLAENLNERVSKLKKSVSINQGENVSIIKTTYNQIDTIKNK